jgi:lipopolysaccharide export system permease protein
MKILDRYVITTFLKNYLLSFFVLVGLYIVLDMVMNFDELVEPQNKGGTVGVQSLFTLTSGIVDFYAHQMFLFFIHLSGVIPVVAAAFTLIRLSRNNELTAIMAAGIPLLRIAAPIIIASVVLNGLLIIDQEVIVPSMIPQLLRDHDELHVAGQKQFMIEAMRDGSHGLFNASRYHPGVNDAPPWIEVLSVLSRNKDFQPEALLTADRAEWDPANDQWNLTNGQMKTGLGRNDIPNIQPWPTYKSSINPDEITLYRSSDTAELLSTERINQLLQREESYGSLDLNRIKHARFTQPLINIILLLLALPWVLSRDPNRLKVSLMYCGLITGGCLATMFLAQQIAGQPPSADWSNTWPALMAWMPIFIFLPVAIFLLDRVHTRNS